MKPFGSIKGKQNLSTVTNASGLWNIEDHHSLRQSGTWPINAVANPQQLRNQSITTDGSYYIRATTSGQTQTRLLYVKFNMVDSKDWVLVMQHTSRGAATVNELGYSIPWKGLCLENPSGGFTYSYFSTYQLYNTRSSDTSTTTGGNKDGYRVFLGSSGGHGFYNTSQLPCNWSVSSGSVGAGYMQNAGACGSWPDGLIMGTGTGNFDYSEQGGIWKTWIWMDTAT